VVDYLWGRPTEILLSAIDRGDAHLGSERVRLLQAGEMAGSSISLPGSVLRSAGLEVLGMGTGTMPTPDVIRRMLAELLDLLASKKLHIDIERVPLSAVGEVWTRDQQGRRPVFIP
jgi:NADPH:quinone reductase-like Zn-dependent oxidoreductase